MQEPTPEAVADALARVFARSEFAGRDLPGPLQFLADLGAVFRDWVLGLIPGGLQLAADAPLVRLAVVLLFAILVVLVGRVLARSELGRLRHRGIEAATDRAVGGPAGPVDAAGWEALAREAARSGRFREAALALYQSVILRLDEEGALRFHEGKTPGDYRREIAGRPQVSGSFESFVRLLLPLAFGARGPDEPAFLRLSEAAAAVGAAMRNDRGRGFDAEPA